MSSILDPADELRLFYCDFKRAGRRPDVPGAVPVAFRMLPGAVMQKMWHHLRFPPFDWFAGRADVFHFTNFTDRPLAHGKSVVSVHDMSFERYPQFAEDKNLRYLRAGMKRTVESADAIITISDFSRREIEELLPAARGKVHVTHLGISADFTRATDAEIADVRKQLGLVRPFLMMLGTVEPRKNLEFLVDVFERVAERGIDLVVAGAKGWKSGPILEKFASTRFPGQLHYLEFVPDGKLAALYSAAELFVMPSHYEGFGFSPLEAMACGTPVLSSSGGSLPEVLGDAAHVMNGFDADEWAGQVCAIVDDGEFRARLVRMGIERAAQFRWSDTARRTLDIYRKVLG